MEDEWKFVSKKKKNYTRTSKSLKVFQKDSKANGKLNGVDYRMEKRFLSVDAGPQEVFEYISRKAIDVESSDIFLECISKLSTHSEYLHFLMLGIGNFSRSEVSCLQLNFGISITKILEIPTMSIFDPIMTDLEKSVCAMLGMEVLSENPHGKYVANENTIYYMPHCPYRLYNNLIWANWSENLYNVTIVGNR